MEKTPKVTKAVKAETKPAKTEAKPETPKPATAGKPSVKTGSKKTGEGKEVILPF